MLKVLMTTFAAVALVAATSAASSAHQTSAGDHHKRMNRHHNVAQYPSKDITSFSSSSALHVGVNHAPKNR